VARAALAELENGYRKEEIAQARAALEKYKPMRPAPGRLCPQQALYKKRLFKA